MDSEVVRSALFLLERSLGKAKDALWQIEAEAMRYECSVHYENPEGALVYCLEATKQVLELVLDAAGLQNTRRSYSEMAAVRGCTARPQKDKRAA